MLYSEILKTPQIQTALKNANVHNVASPLLKDGDFSMDLNRVDGDIITFVTDKEILVRRQHIEYEKKMAPIRKKEERVSAVKPHVEKLIQGKLFGAYSTLEKDVISHIAETIAEQHDFTQVVQQPKEDLTGFSELDKILKMSAVTYLDSQVKKPEDVVLHFVLNSPFAKMLK